MLFSGPKNAREGYFLHVLLFSCNIMSLRIIFCIQFVVSYGHGHTLTWSHTNLLKAHWSDNAVWWHYKSEKWQIHIYRVILWTICDLLKQKLGLWASRFECENFLKITFRNHINPFFDGALISLELKLIL